MTSRYILRSPDGRLVTNDTQLGVALTRVVAQCYVWESYEIAERARLAYQAMLGTSLTVEVHTPSAFLRR